LHEGVSHILLFDKKVRVFSLIGEKKKKRIEKKERERKKGEEKTDKKKNPLVQKTLSPTKPCSSSNVPFLFPLSWEV